MKEFAEKGLEARIEDIAEIAGANRRMAYYYFGSKRGSILRLWKLPISSWSRSSKRLT